MKISEALEYDRRLWSDIAAIPDPEVQDRYLGMAEQTGDFRAAQVTLAGLAKVGRDFANAISTVLSSELAGEVTQPANAETDQVPPQETESATEESGSLQHAVSCEPLIPVPKSERPGFREEVGDSVDSLLEEHARIQTETTNRTQKLGLKKANRERNRAEAQIDRLFYQANPDTGERTHLAADPAVFCNLHYNLLERVKDPNISEHKKSAIIEFGRRLLSSGESFTAEHADELTVEYVEELLFLWSREMLSEPETRGVAGHLLRGYFKSIADPQTAVARLEKILEAYTASYRDRDVLRIAGQGIFLWYLDAVRKSPLFENLVAASISDHQPGLTTRARQLLQLPIMHLSAQLRIGFEAMYDRIRSLEAEKEPAIKAIGARVMAGASQTILDYRKVIERYDEDEKRLHRHSLSKADREEGLRAYLEEVSYEPGPCYTAIYLIPSPIMQRFEAVLGNADFIGNPPTDTVVLDADYTVDFVWPKEVSEADRAALRVESLNSFVNGFVINRPPAHNSQTLEQAKAQTASQLGLVNYRMNRVCIGGYKTEGQEEPRDVAFLRRRVDYDDEHTSPLADFDVLGFESNQPVGETQEHIERIESHKKRFVPKRGIRVVVSDSLIIQSGLTELTLRSVGSSRLAVNATIHGHDRTFQIKNYQFFDKRGARLNPTMTEQSKKFASFCIRVLSEWMCREAVETNEGTVQEGKDGPIKGGYFAYLRIRDDGLRYQRSDTQWYACAEEKELDLDEESRRLMPLDPTGQGRNSTYYREHPNDGGHLPPLRIYI